MRIFIHYPVRRIVKMLDPLELFHGNGNDELGRYESFIVVLLIFMVLKFRIEDL